MILIRRADPHEAEILSEIAMSAKRHWGYPERWLEIWKPQLTFSPGYFEEHESWVADVDRTPVAFCTLLERQSRAWIENLWVAPAWMGRGVGRRLFTHALESSRRRGFKTLQLEADPNAVGFYEKMGMKLVGKRISDVDGQPRSLPILELRLEA